jgi:hypothetical protein
VQDVRCLRYILRALDSVFVNVETRNLLPMALGLTESGKTSCSKIIRQIVDLCLQSDGSSEFVRQCGKLRCAVSAHLLNILRMSNSLGQYFTSGSRREDDKLYERLERHLRHNRVEEIRA